MLKIYSKIISLLCALMCTFECYGLARNSGTKDPSNVSELETESDFERKIFAVFAPNAKKNHKVDSKYKLEKLDNRHGFMSFLFSSVFGFLCLNKVSRFAAYPGSYVNKIVVVNKTIGNIAYGAVDKESFSGIDENAFKRYFDKKKNIKKSIIKTLDNKYRGALLDNRKNPKSDDPIVVCFAGNYDMSIYLAGIWIMNFGHKEGEYVCFDRPGYGITPEGEDPLCEAVQKQYVESVFEYVKTIYPNRPIIVVGHSLGGFEASCAIKQFGDIIKKAYIFAPATVKGVERAIFGGHFGLSEKLVDILANNIQKYLVWDSLDSIDNLKNTKSKTKIYLYSGVPKYKGLRDFDFLSLYYTVLQKSSPLSKKPSQDDLNFMADEVKQKIKQDNKNLNISVKICDGGHCYLQEMINEIDFS